MKKLNLTLCLIMATIFTVCFFSGCNTVPEYPPEEVTQPDETTASDDQISESDSIKTVDLSKYTIVRSEFADEKVKNSLTKLRDKILDVYEVELMPKDDFFKEGVAGFEKGEYEILIGSTNREESIEFLSDKKYNDYGYAIIGKKLVIAGIPEAATEKAVNKFIYEQLKSKNDGDFFKASDAYLFRDTYTVKALKFNGVPANQYTIVYKKTNKLSEKSAAQALRASITDLSGDYLPIVSDNEAASQYELFIGDCANVPSDLRATIPTLKDYECFVTGKAEKIWLTADNASGIIMSVGSFTKSLKSQIADEIDHEIMNGQVINDAGTEITTMSFNVYVNETTRSSREAAVIGMIQKYMPDTIGLQEVSVQWKSALERELGGIYGFVGLGRDQGGGGEHNLVLYHKSKFTLKESGTRWLSDNPNVPGSKFSSSSLPRIMSYALLERKSDGLIFVHVNTHLEHKSEAARVEQMAVLLKEIEPLRKYPIIMTGDFNTTSTSNVYKSVVSNGFVNASKTAQKSSDENTFSTTDPNRIIDFIFCTEGNIAVKTYSVCTEKIKDIYPSDHFPIYSECLIFG